MMHFFKWKVKYQWYEIYLCLLCFYLAKFSRKNKEITMSKCYDYRTQIQFIMQRCIYMLDTAVSETDA